MESKKVVKCSPKALDRPKTPLRFHLAGVKIVALGLDLKAIYRKKN